MAFPSPRGPARAALLSAALLFAAAAEGGDGFVTGTGDVPLMAGLVEAAEGGLVFDTPAGRIVEAYATGAVTRRQVLDFYAGTLPQLGWTPAGVGLFAREDEILRVEFPPPPDAPGIAPRLVVRFALSPTARAEDK